MFGIPASELALLAAGFLLAGGVMGFFAGLFGVGGGAIIVPVLYEAFRLMGVPEEVRMPLCVGTSLAIIIPTSIRSYRAHKAKGSVDLAVLRQWAVPVVLGVVAGGLLARYAPPAVFKLAFIAIAGASATKLLFGRESWRIAADLPAGLAMRGYGLLIGLGSALMGIGGGQIANLLMTLHGRPIHQAVSTSAGLGVIISIPGAIGYVYAGWPQMAVLPPLSLGYVSLIGFALVVPTSMGLAPVGARLAHRLNKRQLEVAFGLFLAAVSLRFLWDMLAR
ncbi:MAG: sulfite exporter TauE/SafE family protein [Thalassobaculales bacterium]